MNVVNGLNDCHGMAWRSFALRFPGLAKETSANVG